MSIKRFALALVFVPLLASCVNPIYSAAERAETAENLRKARDPATYLAMDCEYFLAVQKASEQYSDMPDDAVYLVIQQVARQRDCSASSVSAQSAAIASSTAVTPLAAPATAVTPPAASASATVQKATLGLHVTPVTPTVVKQFGLPSVRGVLVLGPVPGSGAEKAGMLAGDIVLEIASTPVNSPSELAAVTSRIQPGFTALLKVWRYRAAIDVLVEVGDNR